MAAEKTYADVCAQCGRGADVLHFVKGHAAGTTPPRTLGQLVYGVVCSPGCLDALRAREGRA